MKCTRFIFIAVVVVFLGYFFFIANRDIRENKTQSPTPQQQTSHGNFETNTDEQGQVTVKVTPQAMTDSQWKFDVVPPKALVVRNGKEVTIPSSEIMQGDIVVLRLGDKVAVDGEITDGETSIDESLVTGESIPVIKKSGDKVVGGSVNLTGAAKFGGGQKNRKYKFDIVLYLYHIRLGHFRQGYSRLDVYSCNTMKSDKS